MKDPPEAGILIWCRRGFLRKYIFSHEDQPKLLHFSVQCAKLIEYEGIVRGTLRNELNF